MATAPTAADVSERVDKIERRIENLADIGERVARTETELKWHKWIAGTSLALAALIGMFFGFQISNARTEVSKRVKEELEKSVVGESRASVKAAAEDAKKMRDSMAAILATTKAELEQANKDRGMSVSSIDGISGAEPSNEYTIMRIKEGSSGVAVFSLSTTEFPSFTSFVLPYTYMASDAPAAMVSDVFGDTIQAKTMGLVVFDAMGLSFSINVRSNEVRLRYTKKDGSIYDNLAKNNHFSVDVSVKVVLINDGPLPEVLTDLDKAVRVQAPPPAATPAVEP